jgi:hypothetical protein
MCTLTLKELEIDLEKSQAFFLIPFAILHIPPTENIIATFENLPEGEKYFKKIEFETETLRNPITNTIPLQETFVFQLSIYYFNLKPPAKE